MYKITNPKFPNIVTIYIIKNNENGFGSGLGIVSKSCEIESKSKMIGVKEMRLHNFKKMDKFDKINYILFYNFFFLSCLPKSKGEPC